MDRDGVAEKKTRRKTLVSSNNTSDLPKLVQLSSQIIKRSVKDLTTKVSAKSSTSV